MVMFLGNVVKKTKKVSSFLCTTYGIGNARSKKICFYFGISEKSIIIDIRESLNVRLLSNIKTLKIKL